MFNGYLCMKYILGTKKIAQRSTLINFSPLANLLHPMCKLLLIAPSLNQPCPAHVTSHKVELFIGVLLINIQTFNVSNLGFYCFRLNVFLDAPLQLKPVDTIGKCQRPVCPLAVSQPMHKMTNL